MSYPGNSRAYTEFWPEDLPEYPGADDLGADDLGADDLDETDPALDGRSVDDLLDDLMRLQLLRAQAAALEADLLVRIAGATERTRQVAVADHVTGVERLLTITDEAREEIAAALRRSPSAVHDQLVDARLLAGPLSTTRDALAAGHISEAHVRVICEQARRMVRSVRPDDDPARFDTACRALQDRVLSAAEDLTPGQTRSLARRAVERIDAERERDRRRQARRGADVSVYPDEDGMAVLLARLPELDALRVGAAIDARARNEELPVRCGASAGERRAAALVDLVCGGGRVVGAEVTATVPLDEVLDPNGPLGDLIDDPSVPVTLRRLLTDPRTGCALDLGRSRYAVSEPLRRWIAARDVTCTFPGCRRRAHQCDIDHVESWQQGGRTDSANLQPLCRRHHHLKTFCGWRVHRGVDPTSWDWLSPLGRRYRRTAPPVLARAGPPYPAPDADPRPSDG
jgi:hypothetical protein